MTGLTVIIVYFSSVDFEFALYPRTIQLYLEFYTRIIHIKIISIERYITIYMLLIFAKIVYSTDSI